jgi:hypothetical protein
MIDAYAFCFAVRATRPHIGDSLPVPMTRPAAPLQAGPTWRLVQHIKDAVARQVLLAVWAAAFARGQP